MKFSEALKISHSVKRRAGREFTVAVVPGCSALTLPTFLISYLAQSREEKRFVIVEAPYGDIVNSIEAAYRLSADALAILLDYPSLDARLGLRRSSKWSDDADLDIVECVQARLNLIQSVVAGQQNRRTVIHPPVLSLPPLGGEGRWQTGSLEASLNAMFARFRASLIHVPGVFFVCPQPGAIDRPRDVDGELSVDFPYDQSTASAIGEGFAKAIVPPVPLKGIITDLDDTLWRGLVGEVGPEGVHWNLDGKSQIHAIYQQLLAAMASRGILVAVASKNEQSIVEAAMARPDMLVRSEKVFPIIASWEPKSQSVAQILKTWNIGADAVIFVDDNPYELAQVRLAFPEIKTMQFFPHEAGKTYHELVRLRDQCHREFRSPEDALRLASIRAAAHLAQEAYGAASIEDFLEGLDATIEFERILSPEDRRPFELVNKTNQFNLNGHRYTESEWAAVLAAEGSLCLAISYSDKFGPLGRIGVLVGQETGEEFVVNQWVLSCRAFGRRIEHAVLRLLLGLYSDMPLRFKYRETAKNRPISEMIGEHVELTGEATFADRISHSLPNVPARIMAPGIDRQAAVEI